MNGLSTQAGMIVAPGGGGGSALLTDLVEWWEDNDQIGVHDGTDYGTALGTATTGPGSLDAWTPTVSRVVSGISYTTKDAFAFAAVVKASGGTLAGLLHFSVGSNNLNITANADDTWTTRSANTSMTNIGDVNAGSWISVVLTSDGAGTTSFYVDGVLVGTSSDATIVSGSPRFYGVSNTFRVWAGDIANTAWASRGWTQADVDEFHNSGSFLTYSDL